MSDPEDRQSHDPRGLVRSCPQCGRRNRPLYERLGHTFRCSQCHTELPPPSEPIDARSPTEFEALISQSALPVLVDFANSQESTMNTPYDLPPELQLFEPHLRTDLHDRGCCANRTGAAASHRGVLETSYGLASRELGTRRILFQ